MSKKLNPEAPYLEQVNEATPESYREWLDGRIAMGLANPGTLKHWHVMLTKNERDSVTGNLLFPSFIVIYDADAMNPNRGNAKQTAELRNYTFTVLYDPTGKAYEKKEEPEDVIEPEGKEQKASKSKGKKVAKEVDEQFAVQGEIEPLEM